ncbi:MAG: hypothetical protein QXD15_06885 [Thermoplasmata archaeon]
MDDDGLKDGQEDLLMPTVYGSTIHTSNIVLHLPGAQSTVHARWEFRAHFGGANWEVPYKVYLDAITPQNEIKQNWLYLQDINSHTLIFVPQTQQDVIGWAVAHPLNTNPFANDTEEDGLEDYYEYLWKTHPLELDSDLDGLSDGYEAAPMVIETIDTIGHVGYSAEVHPGTTYPTFYYDKCIIPPGVYRLSVEVPYYNLQTLGGVWEPVLDVDILDDEMGRVTYTLKCYHTYERFSGEFRWYFFVNKKIDLRSRLDGKSDWIKWGFPRDEDTLYTDAEIWQDTCLLSSIKIEKVVLDPINFFGDKDHDGLLDTTEIRIHTDPEMVDTDGDSLLGGTNWGDQMEYNTWHTNPADCDTDGDYIFDPIDPSPFVFERDFDNDGFSNMEEILIYGSDWQNTQNFIGYFINSALFYHTKDGIPFYQRLYNYLNRDTLVVKTKVIVVEFTSSYSLTQKIELIKGKIKEEVRRGMIGAVFVGDLFGANSFPLGSWGGEPYPIGLYFEDLDGIWEDINGNKIFEDNEMKGAIDPEIWLSLLLPPIISSSLDTTYEFLQIYFERVKIFEREYRESGFTKKWLHYLGPPSREVVYSGASGYLSQMGFDLEVVSYSDPTIINYVEYFWQHPGERFDGLLIDAHGRENLHGSVTINGLVSAINAFHLQIPIPLVVDTACWNARFHNGTGPVTTITQFLLWPSYGGKPLDENYLYPIACIASSPKNTVDNHWKKFFLYYPNSVALGSMFLNYVRGDTRATLLQIEPSSVCIFCAPAQRMIFFGDGGIVLGGVEK